ncbi:MAG: carboxypeptidase-like regulatory domain-containing protein [Planctomycetota bacterium]
MPNICFSRTQAIRLLTFVVPAFYCCTSLATAGLFAQETQGKLLQSESEGVLRYDTSKLESSVSLIERIKNCPVTTVEGEEHGPVFNVDGVVKLADGAPAIGATVILRESPQVRVSSQPTLTQRPDMQLLAVPDVFARTKTDEEGRYQFANVKSPKLPPDRFGDRWEWDVVAVAGDQLGIKKIYQKRAPVVTFRRAAIRLQETSFIRAQVLDPDGKAVPNAIVSLSMLTKNGQLEQREEFIAWMSVLTPMAISDEQGWVLFEHVPVQHLASVQTYHQDFIGGSAMIATSEEMSIQSELRERYKRLIGPLQSSPAQVNMEVGKRIAGRVTALGKPIQGVKVRYGASASTTETDANGEFELHYSARRPPQGPATLLLLPPQESYFLYRYVQLDWNTPEDGKPMNLELEQGVRLKGKVICEGEPVARVAVTAIRSTEETRPITREATCKEDGSFEFVVPAKSTTVFVTSDVPGFKLASTQEGRTLGDEVPADWPQQSVELSSEDAGKQIELAPLVVERNASVQVQVLLPDGERSKSGTVRITDKSLREGFPDEDISSETLLDESGRASMLLTRIASNDAAAVVRVETEDAVYFGQEKLSNAAEDGVLKVPLEEGLLLRGKVLLNEKPAEDAVVVISKTEPMNERGGFRSSPIGRVETGENGEYSTVVPPSSRYMAMVGSIPGLNEFFTSGYTLQPGESEFRTFDYRTGSEEIHGVVQDSNRKPLPGVSVSVSVNYRKGDRFILAGWKEASQKDTDEQGKFVLRNLPKGEFEIRAYKREAGTSLTSAVTAEAGDKNVKIFLRTGVAKPTPRLQVKSISDY